jgi:hypothetical protein
MRSNWWPIAAFLVMALWLVTVNHTLIGLDFHFTPEHYAALAQLDSTVHFAVALALTATFTQVYGWRWTLPRMILIMVAWEILEAVSLAFGDPNMFAQPGRLGLSDSLYYAFDTADDLALGFAGAAVGSFFGAEPLNTADDLDET